MGRWSGGGTREERLREILDSFGVRLGGVGVEGRRSGGSGETKWENPIEVKHGEGTVVGSCAEVPCGEG